MTCPSFTVSWMTWLWVALFKETIERKELGARQRGGLLRQHSPYQSCNQGRWGGQEGNGVGTCQEAQAAGGRGFHCWWTDAWASVCASTHTHTHRHKTAFSLSQHLLRGTHVAIPKHPCVLHISMYMYICKIILPTLAIKFLCCMCFNIYFVTLHDTAP